MNSADEQAYRRAAIGSTFAELKIDALFISSPPNIRYLTGFTGSNGMLLLERDRAVFLTDPRYRIQAAQQVSCPSQVGSGPLLPRIIGLIKRRRIPRLGVERNRIGFEQYDYLRSELPVGASIEPVNGVVERLRMVKSESEIALIRQSVATNSRAFEAAAAALKPGKREFEVAAELDFRMRKFGAEAQAFDTIVTSGERSALPHARPTDTAIAANQLVLVDAGAIQTGYASDMTRMLYLGSPSRRLKELYRTVLEAQLAAIDAVRPGISAGRVDRAARDVFKLAGLDKSFVHSTGHGLGLEIHEPPRIGRKDKMRLEKGMTITIEPGVYIEGFCGIRIEDTVLVTASGCEVLTPTSKDLRLV